MKLMGKDGWLVRKLRQLFMRKKDIEEREYQTDMGDKQGKKEKEKEKEVDSRQKCYMNRELSWLKFNERVLNEAGNPRVPLAERLSFASIYQSNLDEFYMVRVGTLMDQMHSGEEVRDNKTNMTSEEQVSAILKETKKLDVKKAKIYEQLMGELEPMGVHVINFNKLSAQEGRGLELYFTQKIAPYLSVNIIGKGQPFPFLNNKDIYAVALIKGKNGKTKLSIIPCSSSVFKRVIEIPTRPGSFMLSEEIILHFMPLLLDKYEIVEKSLVRVTRNADIDADTMSDEELDYRAVMEDLIRKRRRMNPVRLELSRSLGKKTVATLCKMINIDKDHVFESTVPLDLSFMGAIQNYLRTVENSEALFYEKRSPRMTAALKQDEKLLPQVEKKDVLLKFPFENIKSFTNLLYEAASDKDVVSIKITVYRLADRSQIVDALTEAADNGKDVTVVVELRARFDEESNIEYSRRLEEAGCRVIYGLPGFKVHSKLCLITKRTDEGPFYITQIGTGNYNEKTSAQYTDLSLITANQDIGQEAAAVFAALLKGEKIEQTNQLLVAPLCLQNKVIDMIDAEIEVAKRGEEAYVGVKINSLTDKKIMEKLIEASQAGVKIEMIVRGICCLVPGIEGYTENIKVISIVGRFLEHSRIYRFGTYEREKMYIASADWMTRNTVRRVEVAVPIYDEDIKAVIREMFETMMRDDEKGKEFDASGKYLDRKVNPEYLNSQEVFFQRAYDAASGE